MMSLKNWKCKSIADCSRRLDRGVLRSEMVPSRLLQDKGNRIHVIGADMEALYLSLSAIEVGEIVYNTTQCLLKKC